MLNNNNISSLDILTLFSFFIGLINYEETSNQSTMQNAIEQSVSDIHKHLEMQDNKLDNLIDRLGGVK